ncbi:Sarcosine oxidase subunit delta [Defluviimonas aquaemixtae]|uniref:Sarcosine oxidase subunit delta n=1 Tax=Albidovulum aquaemixtae TaxID=1542388 RepID=A0A2R8B823_9RHOB|nr:sarcosine oxidase subunit delta [Defluviimonas aquaemixtae]SPH18780.1 Sarcosine oxidase subunit delta [Defluviimonas aquaemixtae]
MRITCPLCGDRDRREFYYYGDAVYADRPAEDAAFETWDDYLHLRDNPAGETRDLWYHELGCSAWIEVTRNTVTHEVLSTRLLTDRAGGGGATPGKSAAKGKERAK